MGDTGRKCLLALISVQQKCGASAQCVDQSAAAAYSMNNSLRDLEHMQSVCVCPVISVFKTVVSYSSLNQIVKATFAIQISVEGLEG